MDKVVAIILAAGKGTRIKSKDRNKVTLSIKGEPMIVRTVKLLQNCGIGSIVVVVGFAKESVMKVLGNTVLYAEQKKRLGTGHAVKMGLEKVNSQFSDVLVANGDDSFLYTPSVLEELYNVHVANNCKISFLSMDIKNPTGLGRVVRNENNSVTGIVEEKDASEEQKKIHEVNLGCYMFERQFLNKYIKQIKKSPVTGEYYIVSLIEMAVKNGFNIEAHKLAPFIDWRGVNTKEDLAAAEELAL